MKVLFINSVKYDYLQDAVFSGLVKNLGAANVRMLPFNRLYVTGGKAYPRNLGHVPNLGGRALRHLLFGFRYDVVILGAAKPRVFETYLKIISQIPPHVPVLFLDGGDEPETGGDLDRLGQRELYEKAIGERAPTIIFKREYIIGKDYSENTVACPFAINIDKLPSVFPSPKKYDVSFWAVESHEIRTRALTLLEDKYDCRENGTTTSQEFHKYKRKGLTYLEELSRCKVVLNFRGGGWDTLRFWETPALGTFMISQKPGIVIPNGFVEDKDIAYCKDDLSDLLPKIDYYLSHEKEREEMAISARERLIQYHTDQQRARYILNHLS